MITVAIVGAGDIGGATAHALAASGDIGRIVIVDAAAKAASGKALDIQQAGAIAGCHARLAGTDDLAHVTGCTVCVVADRFSAGSPEWTGDDGLGLVARLVPALSGAPLVFAGASQATLIERSANELGINRSRLVGSAPAAFASAATSMVALEAHASPTEVNLAVLGKPPRGWVVPWGEATIAGHRLDQRLDAVQIARLQSRLARLWPPGPYLLGLAAARVVTAIATSGRRTYSVLTVLDGEFGVKHSVGSLPSLLSHGGIVRSWEPVLSTRDRVQLETALVPSSLQESR